MTLSALPTVNAILNSTCAVLLAIGLVAIRRKRRTLHIRCMLAAAVVSGAFLVSYLTYHAVHGSTRFEGEGLSRLFYFAVLLSHTVLAVANVPLVLLTLYRAARGNFAAHRRIARVAWPVWMYVSVTGVLVYFLLYHWG